MNEVGTIRNHLMKTSIEQIVPHSELLFDIGSGVRPCLIPADKRVLIEPHGEYVEVLKKNGYDVWQGTIQELLPKVPSKATVLFLDVLEHLTRLEGEAILKLLERFKRVVLSTPDGFMPQEPKEEGEKDPWGYDGWKWQKHVSGWRREDFQGWTVTRWGKLLLCYR